MTFDELVQDFDKAYCEKLDHAEGTRAGVRAVVVALREEMTGVSRLRDVQRLFEEIISSDAGADAARKAYWDKHYGTDEPAPAVCVWTLREAAWERSEWQGCELVWRTYTQCPVPTTCPSCGKPIKFGEAK